VSKPVNVVFYEEDANGRWKEAREGYIVPAHVEWWEHHEARNLVNEPLALLKVHFSSGRHVWVPVDVQGFLTGDPEETDEIEG